MSTLQGQFINDSYRDLLQVSNNNIGIDETSRYIEDGEGTPSILSLSTTRVGVGTTTPAYTLDVAGDINLTGSLKVNGADAVFSNWTVNGADVYRSAGNVGIGVASPARTLHVAGDVNIDTGDAYMWQSGDAALRSSNKDIIFETYNTSPGTLTEKMKISAEGLVRIGGGTPAHILDVQTSWTNTFLARLDNLGGDSSAHGLLVKVGRNDANGILLGVHNSDEYKFYVRADGNVGIGTTTPETTLHVAGRQTIEWDSPILVLKDTNGGDVVEQTGFISYRDNDDVERGFVGYGSAGTKDFHIYNKISGDVVLGNIDGETVRVDQVGDMTVKGGVYTQGTYDNEPGAAGLNDESTQMLRTGVFGTRSFYEKQLDIDHSLNSSWPDQRNHHFNLAIRSSGAFYYKVTMVSGRHGTGRHFGAITDEGSLYWENDGDYGSPDYGGLNSSIGQLELVTKSNILTEDNGTLVHGMAKTSQDADNNSFANKIIMYQIKFNGVPSDTAVHRIKVFVEIFSKGSPVGAPHFLQVS